MSPHVSFESDQKAVLYFTLVISLDLFSVIVPDPPTLLSNVLLLQ